MTVVPVLVMLLGMVLLLLGGVLLSKLDVLFLFWLLWGLLDLHLWCFIDDFYGSDRLFRRFRPLFGRVLRGDQCQSFLFLVLGQLGECRFTIRLLVGFLLSKLDRLLDQAL